MDKINFLHCDARDFFSSLERDIPKPNGIHCFTSPRYNRGVNYGPGINDKTTQEEWVNLVSRVIVDFFNFQHTYYSGVKASFWLQVDDKAWEILRDPLKNLHFKVFKIVWIKSLAPEEGEPWGQFRPTPGPVPHCSWEWVIRVFDPEMPETALFDRRAPGIGVPCVDDRNYKRFLATRSAKLRCRGNVWEAKLVTRKTMQHPCPFPPAIVELALRGMNADSGSLVLDPFCGIGSSAVAAKALGAYYVGGDLNRDFLNTARDRVSKDRG